MTYESGEPVSKKTIQTSKKKNQSIIGSKKRKITQLTNPAT